jgi:hypothetical protein
MKFNILTAVLTLAIAIPAAATDAPATLMTTPGKAVFSDDFAKGLGKDWTASKGKWDSADGGVRVAEIAADMHGAVARKTVTFTDAVIAFDFKLDGAKSASLSLNGAKGHIGRVLISAGKFTVNKDDQDGKNGPDKQAVLGTCTTAIAPAEWHTMVVEIRGPEILATLDGKQHAHGSHAALEKEKTNIGLTAAGESVTYRNLKLYDAKANADWAKAKAKLFPSK